MKMIIAIVRPVVIDKLVTALDSIENFPGITVSDVEGLAQRLKSVHYDSLHPLKPYKQIKIAAEGELLDEIISTIRQIAHTGKKGDGIIWTMPIESSVLI